MILFVSVGSSFLLLNCIPLYNVPHMAYPVTGQCIFELFLVDFCGYESRIYMYLGVGYEDICLYFC